MCECMTSKAPKNKMNIILNKYNYYIKLSIRCPGQFLLSHSFHQLKYTFPNHEEIETNRQS